MNEQDQEATTAFVPLRRVVTGHDEQGRSTVWLDGAASNQREPADRLRTTLMWLTGAAPDYLRDEDAGLHRTGIAPPAAGSRFSVLQIAPGNEVAGLHRTDSIDYAICLQGPLQMVLDTGETTLQTGDVVIQRGTNHAWRNRSDTVAVLAVVLVDAWPKRADSISGEQMAH
ncbi:cupin domain-containing protein [Paraburkholderia sp. J12]|uniref:cupin domain-containing protein n=1 Tax=Paraburkholderia sp. J12 TaxID=2805432 RepID=UPI002ABE8913|nr:cupin domain-containing protein [Paraburkholderia sp. J12]